ncbi:urea ABC transporter permease subunit UrtB [bacterium M00.F.Ca.ET.228.01.1.1]|uniref:Urea ABC transporter, permease protein UrtB n=1 Tax=Burkholderia sp. (strain CCGE1003) TaxID=640512 RepID=E1TAU6_BURSG|nr:urea ABC transporter permease subunit UrtB [Paraburkholderia phenoliruptrix]TGP43165.1 urea ABC transporter permease subunit UrtB [bacterium M00.F.Ca.ET.228.01.1.1]TGS00603.1 urea ABC transporter permease subunit UrtB [bacterium M00.F.Ca.ET.191.01.1.1]TGU04989.1 urea ABC transporter permease subunit UrtB [bacterium M00.F.Ca.ET.155.01.1.1]MBW0446901.1 urea ABC transporter permease subunit UrtB [Paraburkholderia phenoliruptrix]MBW9099397.1 urea ABC transporter permease subunit UrtB [Paraburkh
MAFSLLTSARRIAQRSASSAALVLLAFGALAPHSAFALSAADVAPLAADDFDAKSAAIDKLIARHDKESLTVLKALSEDGVLATDSGTVLLQDGDTTRDAVTGKTVEAGDAQPVTLNNLLRAKVAGALSGLQLDSPDKTTRAEAIDALLKNPDASIKPLIDAARAKETDPALKKRLDTLWAMTALHDADAAKRLEAVQLVAARHDLEMNELLRPLVAKKADGSFAESDERVRAAAQSGLDELDAIRRRSEIAGTLFAGLSLGSVLLLAALGLAITYGLIGVINMAHGEFLMIGAYATYVVQNLFQRMAPGAVDWYPLVAVPASFAAAALVGIVIERLVLKHLYGRPLETLLTTFGISLILIQATRMLFGAQNVQVVNPSWMSGGVTVLPGLILPYNRLAILAFALIVVGIAWAVLTKTRLGLFVRAVTQNRRMAACVGVKTARVDSYAFAFGAGIAGLGGCALSQIGNVGPDLGQSYIIDSFMAVVLGGVGQLAGTVIGGFGLGLVSKAIEPFWGAVLAKIAVLVLIVLFIQKRPQGMFALKGRSAEA